MGKLNFDLDVLRSFVTGIDLGSFAKAADKLGRSTSAISSQLKKLEGQIGTPVLKKSGRGLVLTPVGEIVFSYARRLLDLNDEAVTAARGANLAGEVRIGFQEDFGEGLLTQVLGAFAKAHPAVRIDAGVARNAILQEQIVNGRLDLALTWVSGAAAPDQKHLGSLPMRWVGHPWLVTEHLHSGAPLPLVVFDAPCLMRSCAIESLDKAGVPWRVAFTSSSLSGIWAAAQAGLGVTVRTPVGKPEALSFVDILPELPSIKLCLSFSERQHEPIVERLSEIVQARISELCEVYGTRLTDTSRVYCKTCLPPSRN